MHTRVGFKLASLVGATVLAMSAGAVGPDGIMAQNVESEADDQTVTIAAGTTLIVRTDQTLDSGQSRQGERFTAKLEGAIVVDGEQVLAKSTVVHGRVLQARAARRVRGRALLAIELTEVAFGDELRPVVTDRMVLEGDRSGTLRRTGTAALIGGVIEGDDGAVTGAAIGGAVSFLTPGRQIRLPAGTLIEFRLEQPQMVRRPQDGGESP